MKMIDINCDMGESYGAGHIGNDAELMPHVSSANIACGFHGGDWNVMHETARVAKANGVAIGAHIHRGAVGADGPVEVTFTLPTGAGGPSRPHSRGWLCSSLCPSSGWCCTCWDSA